MKRLCLLALVGSSAAFGHGMKSGFLDLAPAGAGAWVATLQLTTPDPGIEPIFPAACDVEAQGGSDARRSWTLRCSGELRSEPIGLRGLGASISDAAVSVDGATAVLTESSPTFTARRGGAAFVAVGVRHIFSGPDHLLFLAALVLLLRKPRAVLAAETAFTLSHSLAYAATALGWVRVNPAAAEACIALSLVLVALDADRAWRDGATPSSARGALAALLFGAVHGLGFAGGLAELGVPDGQLGPALVGFGLGVELGQVAFLGAALGAFALAARARALPRLAALGSWAIGVLGAFWFWQRLTEVLA